MYKMKVGYVLNIYDSLNFDIFIKDIDDEMSDVISERFTYCATNDIMDTCLYDTAYCTPTQGPIDFAFSDDESDYSGLIENIKDYNTTINKHNINNTTNEGQSYRCHMKDLRFRTNSRMHHDFNISKKMLIELIWN